VLDCPANSHTGGSCHSVLTEGKNMDGPAPNNCRTLGKASYSSSHTLLLSTASSKPSLKPSHGCKLNGVSQHCSAYTNEPRQTFPWVAVEPVTETANATATGKHIAQGDCSSSQELANTSYCQSSLLESMGSSLPHSSKNNGSCAFYSYQHICSLGKSTCIQRS